MNHEVFITCALTEAGDTTGKSSLVPVTPEEIAKSGGVRKRIQLKRVF